MSEEERDAQAADCLCERGQVTDDLTLDASKIKEKGVGGEERENKPRATGETGPFDSRSPRVVE